MLKKNYWSLLTVIMAVFFLVGCSSMEEEVQEGVDVVKATFTVEVKESNKTLQSMQVYFPFYYEIVDEVDNNVLLSNGSEDFILFYNDQEDSQSKLLYENALLQNEFMVNEVIENDLEFQYILVSEVNEKLVEVTVGIGGKKITSQMKPKNLVDNGKVMVNILRSVQLLPVEKE